VNYKTSKKAVLRVCAAQDELMDETKQKDISKETDKRVV